VSPGTLTLARSTATYSPDVESLRIAMRAYRRAEGGRLLNPDPDNTGTTAGDGDQGEDEHEAKKRRNGVAVICRCDTPRRIRVAWIVWEAGPITCGVCGGEFYDPDNDTTGAAD